MKIKVMNTTCSGCSACVLACSQQAISMQENEKGFMYPVIDETKCIDCGLCGKVCACLENGNREKKQVLHTYAVKYLDDGIRETSQSGGLFYGLAEQIINQGGGYVMV